MNTHITYIQYIYDIYIYVKDIMRYVDSYLQQKNKEPIPTLPTPVKSSETSNELLLFQVIQVQPNSEHSFLVEEQIPIF
jgi:hypothetical protein